MCIINATIQIVEIKKCHTFTSPGTFTVNKILQHDGARNTVGYLVVAGGGAGSNNNGGGGGAGGYREGRNVKD